MKSILPLLILFSCFQCKDNISSRIEKIFNFENKVTKKAVARKLRSIKILKIYKTPYFEHLPPIQDETQVQLRTKEEIVNRAICLSIVAARAEGLEIKNLKEIIKEYDVEDEFTDKENEFIFNDVPTKQEKIDALWRYESCWVLLWALSYVNKLDFPNKMSNVIESANIIVNRGKKRFLHEAMLRSKSEILNQADLVYRYNWAARQAELNKTIIPRGLKSRIVYERHYALSWLINYMDKEWDEISTGN